MFKECKPRAELSPDFFMSTLDVVLPFDVPDVMKFVMWKTRCMAMHMDWSNIPFIVVHMECSRNARLE